MRILAISVLLVAILASPCLAIQTTSPSGNLTVGISVGADGRLAYYAVGMGGFLIDVSPIGVVLDGVDMGRDVTLGEPRVREVDETYPWRGNKPVAVNHYREYRFPVTKDAETYYLDLRVFDDGFTFRCEFGRWGACPANPPRSLCRWIPQCGTRTMCSGMRASTPLARLKM